MKGLIHVYCGDGKGKTTASAGLAVRAAGAGKEVLFVQFFKNGLAVRHLAVEQEQQHQQQMRQDGAQQQVKMQAQVQKRHGMYG